MDQNDNEKKDIQKNSLQTDDKSSQVSSSFNFKLAIVSGIFTIFGVVIGSILAGYFTIKAQTTTQTIIGDQQKSMFAKQISQKDREELKNILSDYTDVLTDYFELSASESLKENDIDRFVKKAFKVAFQITILVSIDLGQKTFELNSVLVHNIYDKKNKKFSSESEDRVIKKFSEWMLVAKGELKLLEYSTTPENLSTDLIRLLLRGGIVQDNK